MFHARRRNRNEPRLDRPASFGPARALRPCEAAGCECEGLYPAPKSRQQLKDYHWFCLEHVRAYNRQWNYCDGLSEAELEAEIRHSTIWERPSWPLGTNQGRRPSAGARLRDDFGLLGEGATAEKPRRPAPRPPGPVVEALAVMGLSAPVELGELRDRYRQLVKKHHPDANGGDREAEERLKLINGAYTTLKRFLG